MAVGSAFKWYLVTDSDVRADHEEYTSQAMGQAELASSAHDPMLRPRPRPSWSRPYAWESMGAESRFLSRPLRLGSCASAAAGGGFRGPALFSACLYPLEDSRLSLGI